MEESIVLGAEYSVWLRRRLNQVLLEMGAVIGQTSWGVAGSQELLTWEAVLNGEALRIESETFIGLSITGERELVRMIAETVWERIRCS